jgi:CTD small phosphatase-like protein 2
VDNSPHAYSYHLENGIPIESWFDDDDDEQLLKLIEFLEVLKTQPDVRPFVRDYFKSHMLVERSKLGLPVKIKPPPL